MLVSLLLLLGSASAGPPVDPTPPSQASVPIETIGAKMGSSNRLEPRFVRTFVTGDGPMRDALILRPLPIGRSVQGALAITPGYVRGARFAQQPLVLVDGVRLNEPAWPASVRPQVVGLPHVTGR